jgi:hypothetical protein
MKGKGRAVAAEGPCGVAKERRTPALFQARVLEFYRRVGTPMTLKSNYPVRFESSSIRAVAFLRLIRSHGIQEAT